MGKVAAAIFSSVTFILSAQAHADFLQRPTSSDQKWSASINSDVHVWTLDGSMVNIDKIDDGLAGTFAASGDSLNLDRENNFQYSADFSTEHWTLGVYHLAMDYDGYGTGLAAVSSGTGGVFINIPVYADIHLEFSVAEVGYNIISTENSIINIGLGGGQIGTELFYSVDNAVDFNYSNTSAFGYLSLNVNNRYNRFFYGFSINTSKFDSDSAQEDHIDYKLNLAYRLIDGRTPLDIHAGWRHMQLKFEIDKSDGVTAADIELKGSFIGIGLNF